MTTDGQTNPRKVVHTLCAVQGCCPTVEVDLDADRITIRDDDGGTVTLTQEQWRIATSKVTLDPAAS